MKVRVYDERIYNAYKTLKETGNLQDFAVAMARIGDVRYEWQARRVEQIIRGTVPENIKDIGGSNA